MNFTPSVPVAAHHQKYLNIFANMYLKFTCMSNGYGPAMKMFTKITKVPFSVLRMQGHTSVIYKETNILLNFNILRFYHKL